MNIPVLDNDKISHIHLYKIFIFSYIFFGSLALIPTVVLFEYSISTLICILVFSIISFGFCFLFKGASKKMYLDVISFLNFLFLLAFCVGCFLFNLTNVLWAVGGLLFLYFIYDLTYIFKSNYSNISNQIEKCFSVDGFDYMLKEEFRRNYKFINSRVQKCLFVLFGLIGLFGSLFGASLPFLVNIFLKFSENNTGLDFFILCICLIGVILMMSVFNSLLVYYYCFLEQSNKWKSKV